MSTPTDLVEHYSTMAFQTRLAALTFVGAVLGADVAWNREKIQSEVLGIGLLLIVGSLAALNRRYTYSFLCACIASGKSELLWRDFRKMNEGPYSFGRKKEKDGAQTETPSINKWEASKSALRRFFLSWGTYLPGLAAGAYLVFFRHNISEGQTVLWCWAGGILASFLLILWIWQSIWIFDPESFLEEQSVNEDGQVCAVPANTTSAAPPVTDDIAPG